VPGRAGRDRSAAAGGGNYPPLAR